MNSINTGKSTSSFNWYEAKNITITTSNSLDTVQLPTLKNSPLPRLPSSHSLTHKDTAQFEDILESNTESEPSRIYSDAFAVESTPLLDTLSPPALVEPSRIFKSPVVNSCFKHPYEISSSDQPIELPMKRVKLQQGAPEQRQILESLDITPSSTISYNTVNDTDLVDFWFSKRLPSEIKDLEELERSERVKNGADPVILGKFYLIQKEFMMAKLPSIKLDIVEKSSSVIDSLSQMKDSIIHEGEKIRESFGVSSLKKVIDEIAEEAVESRSFGKFESYIGEKIDFTWPRVPSSIRELEEQARSEKIAAGSDAVLFGKIKFVNAEIRKKMELNGMSKLKNATIGLAEQAVKGFNFAKHFTSELLHFSQLKINEEKEERDTEWFRLQEEMERARRINQESVDTNVDFNRKQVERQLLDSVRAL